MDAAELKIKLDLHLKWINNEEEGVRADLRWADLRWANLQGDNLQEADLREADLREADLRGADLREANLREANLRGADLRVADLRGANLRWADLRGADLDFSSGLFFGCKSFKIKADLRLAAQLAYHFCRIDFTGCEDAIAAQSALKSLANQFHRVEECGRIE